MVEVAREVLGDEVAWGVGTECGWGRTGEGEVEGIMAISREVAGEVFSELASIEARAVGGA